MDLICDFVEDHFFETYGFYNFSNWQRDDWKRQIVSLYLIVTLGGLLLYLVSASLSFWFIFDKRLLRHKKILPNQIWLEIQQACASIPLMSIPSVAIFFAEIRGWSRLYDGIEPFGIPYLLASIFSFLFFTDFGIYWIHRWLHHPLLYRHIHKPHHKWLMPTPFASHAFHPLDGFLQSTPYHIYAFLFPLEKRLYLGLFIFVNLWTVSIHDGNYKVPKFLEAFINGAAHHNDHHLFFTYNYGQYFTLWDKLGGTFKHPTFALTGEGHLRDLKKEASKLKKK
eukprot:Sdes_comp19375_c0_seq3m10636